MRFFVRTVFLALVCVSCLALSTAWAATTALESMGALGVAGNGPSWGPTFDPSLRYHAFSSTATNLAAVNTPVDMPHPPHHDERTVPLAQGNVFVRDRLSGVLLEVLGHDALSPEPVLPDGPVAGQDWRP